MILSFLDSKIKSKEDDPDGKWMRTWNDYLQRIKYFFRWLYNEKLRQENNENSLDPTDWITPSFLKIKEKKSKRISHYLESEIWDKDDFNMKRCILFQLDSIRKVKNHCIFIILSGCSYYKSLVKMHDKTWNTVNFQSIILITPQV
jgi:hypothetical protein